MSDETIEEYHADTDWHTASMYKAMLAGPRVFEQRVIKRTKFTAPALQLGSLVHAMALEPHSVAYDYAIAPTNDRRTKAYKEWAAKVDPEQTVVTTAESDTAQRCVDALNGNPIIKDLLDAKGFTERSHRWEDDTALGKCKVKMRADKVIGCGYTIMDVKTIRELTERDVMKTFWNFGYHIQAAHYALGVANWFGYEMPETIMFVFAYVETQEPFRSLAYTLDQESMSRSIEQRNQLQLEVMRRMKSQDFAEPNENQLTFLSLPEGLTK